MASSPQHVVIVAPEYRTKGTRVFLGLGQMLWGGAILMFLVAWLSDHTGLLSAHPGYWACVVGYWLFSAVVSGVFQTWKPEGKFIV